MVAEGPLFTGVGANFNDGGLTAWSNPTNIQGDTTSTAATCSIGTNGAASQRLRCSTFGFALPSTATVVGVLVEVEQSSANNSRQRWNSIRLLIAGAESGDDLSDAANIQTTKLFKSFGGASELWGLTPTAAQVNASGFGVSLKIDRNSTSSTTTSFFRCRITVTYTDNKLVTPATKALTLTTFAPTVTASTSDNKLVTPQTASLTLTAFAPTIAQVRIDSFDCWRRGEPALFLDQISSTGNFDYWRRGEPIVGLSAEPGEREVRPLTKALVLTTFAPTVSVAAGSVTVIPGTAVLALTTFAPTVTVSDNKIVVPPTATLSLTTFAPTVTAAQNVVVTPGTAAIALTTSAPIISVTSSTAKGAFFLALA
jgi:hypothetical protein